MDDMENLRGIEHLINSGQLPAALASLEKTKKAEAASGRLLFLEAVVHHRLGDYPRATGCYREALALEPAMPGAWRNLAALCYVNDDNEGVIEAVSRYREFVPYDREVYGWLVFTLANVSRLGEAEEIVDDYRTVYPYDSRVLAGWSYVLEKQRRFVNALRTCCQAGAETLESSLVGHVALASSHNLGNTELSRLVLDQVFTSPERQEDSDYLSSLADLTAMGGDLGEALELYEQAVKAGYSDADGMVNMALVYLASGDYENGWKYYLQRSAARYKRLGVPGIPEWRGEPLQGKTILVHSEQGFGDVIQFIRYLPYLRETGAQVIFNTYPDVLKLVKHDADATDRVEIQLTSLEQCEFQTYMMDFPALLRPRGIADFPADVPYLHASPEKVDGWRKRLAGHRGGRIGIVWSGNPDHFNDHNRSAAFSDFALLGSLPGITWFSLQKGAGERELGCVPPGMTLVDLAPELTDFSETAAAVANLDLIICVDTSVAHLVGALGYDCWLLLPAEHQDWRWRQDPHRTPWYPQMRLYVQESKRDWSGLLDRRVRPALAQWVLDRHDEALSTGDRIALGWHAGGEVTDSGLAAWAPRDETAAAWLSALATARWLALQRDELRPLARLRSTGHCPAFAPAVEAVWSEALLKQGDREGAGRCWKEIEAAPATFLMGDAMVAWIGALIEQSSLELADTWLERALQRFPENSALCLLAAKAASLRGEPDAALAAAEKALRYSPRSVNAHVSMARLLAEKDRLAAGDHFQKALLYSPDNFSIWAELAHFAFSNRAPRLAALIVRALLSRRPCADLSVLLAAALAEMGEADEAARVIHGLDRARLTSRGDLYLLAMAQGRSSQEEAQEATLRTILERYPEAKEAHFMLAVVLLKNGRCAEGWREYNLGITTHEAFEALPEWTGQHLSGKRLLVYQDQGYGDLIQFFSLIRRLHTEGELTLAVMPDIVDLVRDQNMDIPVFSRTADAERIRSMMESGAFDYQVPFMKLPGLLGADLTRAAEQYPYLFVTRHCIPPGWGDRFAADPDFKVGMAWAGNPLYSNDHHRSSALDDWLPLASIPGVSFYSFQKDAASSQAYGCPQFAFKNIAADCDSLLQTASALQAMDLFIGVDTGLAHLAAAMGKETWILIPDIGTDFRWLKEREDSPWYPSVRLFRQRSGERWAAVLARVTQELASRLAR